MTNLPLGTWVRVVSNPLADASVQQTLLGAINSYSTAGPDGPYPSGAPLVTVKNASMGVAVPVSAIIAVLLKDFEI